MHQYFEALNTNTNTHTNTSIIYSNIYTNNQDTKETEHLHQKSLISKIQL